MSETLFDATALVSRLDEIRAELSDQKLSLPDPFSDAAGCLQAAKESIAMAQDLLEAEFGV